MPGIAGPGNLYVANVKWWVSVYSELANSSGTRVRIFWRPLEGIKTSRSTLTGSTSVLQEKEPEEEMSLHMVIYRASLIIVLFMFIIVVKPKFHFWHYHNSILEVRQIN